MEHKTVLDHFLHSLEQDYDSFPDKAELLKNLSERFQSEFSSPPIDELSKLLRFNVSIHDARRIMFVPTDDEARYYTAVLFKAEGRLKSSMLSLLFLKHRKQWGFLRVFVLTGGLAALCRLLTDSNLYTRGQAMETFLSVTDCDTYDWFSGDMTPVSTCLHFRLYSLMGDDRESFLAALCHNRAHSYPGGSFHALQILAFWLSWIRARFSTDQRIKLHPHILRELEAWATTESADGGVPPEIEENERKLALTIWDDFKRETALDVADPDAKGYEIGGVVKPASFTDVEALCSGAMSLLFPDLKERSATVSSPEELKEAGNKYYKESNFVKAFEAYTLAKRSLEGRFDVDMQSAILFNLASVHWKFYKSCEDTMLELGSKSGKNDSSACLCGDNFCRPASSVYEANDTLSSAWDHRRLAHLTEAESLSRQVIDLSDGAHTKAIYRLASCMMARDQVKEAYELLDKSVFSLTARGALPSEIDMLKGLMRHCIASVLAKSDIISTGNFSSTEAYDSVKESNTANNEVDLITSELSCLKTGGGNPVLSKSTADILRRLRMRDRYEREGFDNRKDNNGLDKDVLKAKQKNPDRQCDVDLARPPSPPKTVASKNPSKAMVKKPSAEETASLVRKKRQLKLHKMLRNVLMQNDLAALKSTILELWEQKFTLSEGLMESLDEEFIIKILEIALNAVGEESSFGLKVLRQLQDCTRFESQLRFAVYGDDVMTRRIRDYIAALNNMFTGSASDVDLVNIGVYISIIQ